MKVGRLTESLRHIDKRWQRRMGPNRRRILVNARSPMNYICIEPIHTAMRVDPRVEFYFMSTIDPAHVDEIYAEAGDDVRTVNPKLASLMRFDAYLVSDFLWKKLPRGTRRIQMFHGVAGKYRLDTPDASKGNYDRYFFINERRMRNYVAAGIVRPESEAAQLIGMPKVDRLVNGSLQRDAVLESLGIDPARRTVLYAPTWSPFSSLNAMGEELVRRLVDAGYAVILKLHDRSRNPDNHYFSGAVDWYGRLGPLVTKGGGHLASGSNSCRYLAAADVMITDHSSIGFEYLLLDRPLIRIEMPELIKNADIHPDYVGLLAESSTTVRNAAGAVEAVGKGLAEPSHQSASRRAVAQEIYYRPGTATARAVSELYRVVELDQPAKSLLAAEPSLAI